MIKMKMKMMNHSCLNLLEIIFIQKIINKYNYLIEDWTKSQSPF